MKKSILMMIAVITVIIALSSWKTQTPINNQSLGTSAQLVTFRQGFQVLKVKDGKNTIYIAKSTDNLPVSIVVVQ